jgi:phosphoglycolate phosphatase
MIRLIVFDWNGTLLSDTSACLDADNHIIKYFGGKPINLKTYRDTVVIPSYNFYALHGCKMAKLDKKFGMIFHSFYEERAKKCRTRKGAKETLKWLYSNSIGSVILSNHTKNGIIFQLKRLRLDSYIKKVLANSELDAPIKKRNKLKKLQDYIKQNHYNKNEIIIVGDSPEESEIAKKIGIKSVLITDGYYSTSRLKKSKPDYIINNLKEIKKIIKE